MLNLFDFSILGIMANQVFLNEQLSKFYNFKNDFKLSFSFLCTNILKYLKLSPRKSVLNGFKAL